MMPETFTFDYAGRTVTAKKADADRYEYNCPTCGMVRGLNTKVHTLTFDADNRPTVRPSIVCQGWKFGEGEDEGSQCTNHTWLTSGVMVDC